MVCKIATAQTHRGEPGRPRIRTLPGRHVILRLCGLAVTMGCAEKQAVTLRDGRSVSGKALSCL